MNEVRKVYVFLFCVLSNRTQDMGHPRQVLQHRATFLVSGSFSLYLLLLYISVINVCAHVCATTGMMMSGDNFMKFFLHLSVGFEA